MRRPTSDTDSSDVESWNKEDASELERPTQLSRYEVVVAARDWTVETMVQQIRQGNIDLDPAFQRRNAWRDDRRSRLIESFILRFPIPQVVLAEHPREKGTFIVIDGKQRLMTIAGLYLKDYRQYWTTPEFSGLKVLEQLNGHSLDEFLESSAYTAERRQLGNGDIRTTVLTGFQDEGVLYDIFYRINTGSVPLSSQELRQVLNRGGFARFLIDTTSKSNRLWDTMGISQPDPRLRDVELLLRLVALRLFSKEYRGNMKLFLDEAMQRLNGTWDAQETVVSALTQQLMQGAEAAAKVFGESAGRKFKDGKYERVLNRALFEVQVYFFSLPIVRAGAIKRAKQVVAGFERLSADPTFLASIEATTKSIENVRIRFDAYCRMLEKATGLDIEPLPLPEAA